MTIRWKNRFAICILSLCAVYMVLFLAGAPRAEAVRAQRIDGIQVEEHKEDDRPFLRIEVLFSGNSISYSTAKNEMLPKQLLIDLPNTELGRVNPNVTLDGQLGRYLSIRQLEKGHHQLLISFSHEVEDHNYRIKAVAGNKDKQEPARIVIDILEPREAPDAMQKAEGLQGRVIVLDPGHGGSDSGARGPTGLLEKDVTLAVAKKLEAMLTASGARVVMTRKTDVDVYGVHASDSAELQARVNIGAFTPKAEVFLSIHCNSFASPSAHGTETFSYTKTPKDAQLAACLQEEMLAAGGLANRGTKTANFYVLKRSAMPSALVELAFISNPLEERLLASEDFQMKMAEALLKGLAKYFGGK
ncbi:hypothetical protein TAMA11512_10370 [Selenomonas sp. TAMA-11512]|uniref:N-acetylmuramoyl-L-alanine amidase family protein n=1 Tax=Selenomonas sp. TAMA-11512 TaxID=3095337 RepID=UPI00308EE6C8|nr:hypothetical protein TAMA11512_10370 [Selenomonas sp. TAMA-11512]